MKPSDDLIPATPSAASYARNARPPLHKAAADNPYTLFETWLSQAVDTELNDANAMSLATLDESGMPDVRIVLLKDVDARGFVFYSNAQSAKGQQLQQGKAALCFHWKSQRRQVRIRGEIETVSEAESDSYFSKRARGSQIGAWASDQSRPVESRQAMVDKVKEIEAIYEGQDVPRPPHWIGWRVKPNSIEFWQDGAFRLHDRLSFTPSTKGWKKTRLFP